MSAASRIAKYKWLITFLAFLAITHLLYAGTIHAKFIYDWNSWMLHYMRENWGGFLSAYGDGAMRWGYHLSNVLIWKLFGFNEYGWHFTFIMLHALNSTLLAMLTHSLLPSSSASRVFIALTVASLWLTSPYHSETVVWGATVLYLVSTALVLTAALLFLKCSERPGTFYLIVVFLCFAAALLTHEGAIILPVLLLTLWWLTRSHGRSLLRPSRFLLTTLLPMLVIVCLYLLANKLRSGTWVGHYGEASHLNTDMFLIVPNFTKYVLKLLFIPLFFSFSHRDAVYALLENHTMVWIQLIVWAVVAGVMLWRFRRTRKQVQVSLALLMLFVIALLPVINLYFMYYKDIEQDRYVYLPSAFFYAALVVGLVVVLRKYAVVPLAACFVLSLCFLNRNTRAWQESGRISNALLFDFRWQDANRVFVLLTPDNVHGAYCMRSMPISTLSEMLRVRRNIDIDDKLFEVYQYNVVSPNDSATYQVLDSNTLRLDLVAPGAWLWHNSFGATHRETEHFKATLNEYYPSFEVTFKNKQPGDVFIYAVDDRWKEVEHF